MEITDIKQAAANQIDAGDFFELPPYPRIALVAGEPSGDNLGAALIQALRNIYPDAEFVGIAGPQMRAAGCKVWQTADSLAVIGLFEVIPHLWRLLRIRRQLIARILANPPDVFIGVDYKEFNLSVERKLKAAGIRTVQYVSPQVWAWRRGRIKKIANAVDLMLCLLPFEKPFYDGYQVQSRYVGHPLADEVPLQINRAAARFALDIAEDRTCIAVLPGSRNGEVAKLGADFARTIAWLLKRKPDLLFVAPMANAATRALFARELEKAGVTQHVTLLDGQAQRAMVASDVVLLASGTATLEALLVKRPMVVAYRFGKLTTFVLTKFGVARTKYFSQPNLLSGKMLVPELFNDEVRADRLGPAVLEQLSRPDRAQLEQSYNAIHLQLRQGASEQAAQAIADLITQPR